VTDLQAKTPYGHSSHLATPPIAWLAIALVTPSPSTNKVAPFSQLLHVALTGLSSTADDDSVNLVLASTPRSLARQSVKALNSGPRPGLWLKTKDLTGRVTGLGSWISRTFSPDIRLKYNIQMEHKQHGYAIQL